MITLSKVSKYYPAKGGVNTVLKDVDYVFKNGINTGLIGPNGAGKSTLMRLISGAELPNSGIIDRQSSVSWPLGFAGGVHGSLSGRENTAFVARIYDRDFPALLDFVQDFAELGKLIDEEVRHYSSGMKARLAFGLSMAVQFDFYLIDEIIAVGDASFKRKCREVLDERMDSASVIFVSHSRALLNEFCDAGCVLSKNKLLHFDYLDDAFDYYETHY